MSERANAAVRVARAVLGVALNGAYVEDESTDYVGIRNLCPTGTVDNFQGEEGHHFFILESGECEAYVHELGTDTLVAKYEPGELFGEKALIENKPRGATVKAVGNCRENSFRASFLSLGR